MDKEEVKKKSKKVWKIEKKVKTLGELSHNITELMGKE
jgi:hypothetical protein